LELRNVTDGEELNKLQVAVDEADERLAAMQKSVEGRERFR
jgi:hypothetical protein